MQWADSFSSHRGPTNATTSTTTTTITACIPYRRWLSSRFSSLSFLRSVCVGTTPIHHRCHRVRSFRFVRAARSAASSHFASLTKLARADAASVARCCFVCPEYPGITCFRIVLPPLNPLPPTILPSPFHTSSLRLCCGELAYDSRSPSVRHEKRLLRETFIGDVRFISRREINRYVRVS